MIMIMSMMFMTMTMMLTINMIMIMTMIMKMNMIDDGSDDGDDDLNGHFQDNRREYSIPDLFNKVITSLSYSVNITTIKNINLHFSSW